MRKSFVWLKVIEMGIINYIIGKKKLFGGSSNFRVWKDIVQSVFEKRDLWDVIKPKDLDLNMEEGIIINI